MKNGGVAYASSARTVTNHVVRRLTHSSSNYSRVASVWKARRKLDGAGGGDGEDSRLMFTHTHTQTHTRGRTCILYIYMKAIKKYDIAEAKGQGGKNYYTKIADVNYYILIWALDRFCFILAPSAVDSLRAVAHNSERCSTATTTAMVKKRPAVFKTEFVVTLIISFAAVVEGLSRIKLVQCVQLKPSLHQPSTPYCHRASSFPASLLPLPPCLQGLQLAVTSRHSLYFLHPPPPPTHPSELSVLLVCTPSLGKFAYACPAAHVTRQKFFFHGHSYIIIRYGALQNQKYAFKKKKINYSHFFFFNS